MFSSGPDDLRIFALLDTLQYMLLSIAMGYGRFAISYLVTIYAVLASISHAIYDGGEWNTGFVTVLST